MNPPVLESSCKWTQTVYVLQTSLFHLANQHYVFKINTYQYIHIKVSHLKYCVVFQFIRNNNLPLSREWKFKFWTFLLQQKQCCSEYQGIHLAVETLGVCTFGFSRQLPDCPLKSLNRFTWLLAVDPSSCFPTPLLALTDFHLIFDRLMDVKGYIKCLIGIFLISSEGEQFSMLIHHFICCFTFLMLAHNLRAFRLSLAFLLISGGDRYIDRYIDYRDRYSAIIWLLYKPDNFVNHLYYFFVF